LELPELDGIPVKGVPIKPTSNSALLKKFTGKPLLVAFDGGFGSSVGTIGVQIAEIDSE